ncbi:hypothetical protein CEUSTIGMA_g7598.t1 [Chlamydomonas eustigma]|uniref:Uncharacterized protein n=1 Tax=Chlamydomonas eustigma TaxID=1157962 RepID=A0A250XBL5_9CHLO|nr:hypothetical protein CEUSTIGMA_g7598.t1 [Chlamydomonas eustigma]|eukprot:GAX80160.1 hypothetical protein CEUSTIGMA_g7598.t1 [Chlamydomonas eustigma]
MGIASSNNRFLEPVNHIEDKWEDYVSAEWRSERMRELDMVGGPGRPALLHGQSFTARMGYLEKQLQDNGKKLEDICYAIKPKFLDGPVKRMRGDTAQKFLTHSERRAAERRGELEDGHIMLNFQTLKYQKPEDSEERLNALRRVSAEIFEVQKASVAEENAPPRPPMAEWRKRVHASRRRTMLTIITALRLKRGHRHPARLPRLDDLSFFIPELLAADKDSFIKDYMRQTTAKQQIETLQAALEKLQKLEDSSSQQISESPTRRGTPILLQDVAVQEGLRRSRSINIQNLIQQYQLQEAVVSSRASASSPTRRRQLQQQQLLQGSDELKEAVTRALKKLPQPSGLNHGVTGPELPAILEKAGAPQRAALPPISPVHTSVRRLRTTTSMPKPPSLLAEKHTIKQISPKSAAVPRSNTVPSHGTAETPLRPQKQDLTSAISLMPLLEREKGEIQGSLTSHKTMMQMKDVTQPSGSEHHPSASASSLAASASSQVSVKDVVVTASEPYHTAGTQHGTGSDDLRSAQQDVAVTHQALIQEVNSLPSDVRVHENGKQDVLAVGAVAAVSQGVISLPYNVSAHGVVMPSNIRYPRLVSNDLDSFKMQSSSMDISSKDSTPGELWGYSASPDISEDLHQAMQPPSAQNEALHSASSQPTLHSAVVQHPSDEVLRPFYTKIPAGPVGEGLEEEVASLSDEEQREPLGPKASEDVAESGTCVAEPETGPVVEAESLLEASVQQVQQGDALMEVSNKSDVGSIQSEAVSKGSENEGFTTPHESGVDGITASGHLSIQAASGPAGDDTASSSCNTHESSSLDSNKGTSTSILTTSTPIASMLCISTPARASRDGGKSPIELGALPEGTDERDGVGPRESERPTANPIGLEEAVLHTHNVPARAGGETEGAVIVKSRRSSKASDIEGAAVGSSSRRSSKDSEESGQAHKRDSAHSGQSLRRESSGSERRRSSLDEQTSASTKEESRPTGKLPVPQMIKAERSFPSGSNNPGSGRSSGREQAEKQQVLQQQQQRLLKPVLGSGVSAEDQPAFGSPDFDRMVRRNAGLILSASPPAASNLVKRPAWGASNRSASAMLPKIKRHSPDVVLSVKAKDTHSDCLRSSANADLIGTKRHVRDMLKEQVDTVRSATSLLSMYINRCNSAWADNQSWVAPGVVSHYEEVDWKKGDQHSKYHADVIRKLGTGKIAIQIFAGNESLVLPGGQQLQLWSSDPWKLLEACRPGMMPAGDRIQGVGLGSRVLCNLVQQATSLVGKDALQLIHVVLHLTEDQEEEVTQELWEREFYGLNRNNFFFLLQEKHPGFKYDAVEKRFVRSDRVTRSQLPLGSGHCMAQMAWPSEAFILDEAGMRQALALPVMEALEKKGVQWVITRRLRDLHILEKDGILDASALAYRFRLRDQSHAGILVDVGMVDSPTAARQYGSVLMRHAGPTKEKGTHAPDVPPQSQPQPSHVVSELPLSELVTAHLIEAVDQARAKLHGKQAVGLGRWLYHLPTMKSILKTVKVFRPRLRLNRGYVHVQLDMADLTSAEEAKCMALESRHHDIVVSPDSMEAFIPVVTTQDQSQGFKEIVVDVINKSQPKATLVAGAGAAGKKPPEGMSIVVFVSTNTVSSKAVNMALFLARPGRDTVHLVTVVPTEMQRAPGQKLLNGFHKQATRNMTDVRADVLVRGSHGLLSCMERYVATECKPGATLVVMGSVQITSNVFDSVVASVTLSFMRRAVGLPLIVVTQNSTNTPNPSATSMKMMVAVESHARPVLSLVCSQLLAGRDRDKLFLALVSATSHLTRNQLANQRRLLESFESTALGHRTPSYRSIRVEGAFDTSLVAAVEEHGIGLMVIQRVPGSKGLLPSQIGLIRSCKGAVLVYQDPVAGDKTLFAKEAA